MKILSKKLSIIPLFATILILLHYVLANALTAPSNAGLGVRYLGYWVLVIVSSIGTNLLALYLGYMAIQTKQPWRNLGKIFFYVVLTGFIGVIWGICFFQTFGTQDLWVALFPISYNNFPFASSMLVWYIVGPFLAKYFASCSKAVRRAITFLLVWFVLFMPFVFKKPLWGITDANSFVWVGVLFIFGILISNGEFKWLGDYKKTISVIVIGLGLAVVMARFNIITQSANELQGRFFSNYGLNVTMISLAIFGILLKLSTTHFAKLNDLSWVNWFTLVAYVVSCLPIVTSHLVSDLHISNAVGIVKWLFLIALYLLILLISVGILTVLLAVFSRFSYFAKLIDRFTIKKFSDLVRAPQFAQRMLYENWRILLVILCGFLFTATQMIVTWLTIRSLSWGLLVTVFVNSINALILNAIIFVLFFLLLFSLINRFWPALIFTSGISIFIGVAEFLKISLRDEPILPADLSMITAFSEIAKMINPIIIIVAGIVLVLMIISSIILQRHLGGMYHRHDWIRRSLTAVLVVIFFSGSFWVNHVNSLPNIILKGFGITIQFVDQANGARANGPILQFIGNLDIKVMDKPSGYSKAKIQAIMRKYDQQAKLINKKRQNTLDKQTVIFVLNESFSDPNRVPEMKVSPNPMPYLTSLKKQTNSGLMLSSGYGGGTANMEWQALTGLSISNLSPTLPTPYAQLVPRQKTAPAFTDLFDSKIAIHPYNASLYNRKQVFKKFGFQQFYYQGSKDKLSYENRLGTSPYVSDESAYKQTMKIAKQSQSGSRFIQLSTMQNHMPFTNYYSSKKFKITGSAFDESNRDSVQTYTQGISYTDKALKKFIRSIDNLNKPVTVVWYGDHLASLYTSSLMDKYPIQLHETDYFVYSNQTHKLSYTNRLVSPYSFSALALSAGNYKVTPYYALVTKVTNDLPAMTINPANTQTNSINGTNIFVKQNSKEIKYKNLSKKQKKLYHEYQLIQYDIVAGNQYSAHWAEQKIK